MDNWDEIRTAYHVARIGTISGAADVLGVHHATVIRHIDALEKRLATRLFQRHARGYTPTEAGRDLMAVAHATEDQFIQLSGRIKGLGETVSGELIVTSIIGISRLIVPILAQFQEQYPAVALRYLTDSRVFKLDYGEAHVAIRAGAAPEEPDNVVQPFARMRTALYASPAYIARHGKPASEAEFAGHRFVAADNDSMRAPFYRWLRAMVPERALTFRAPEPAALEAAVREGVGIGFVSIFSAQDDTQLVEIMPSRPEWEAPLWLVTHVDLHRTRKVQALLQALKEGARDWNL